MTLHPSETTTLPSSPPERKRHSIRRTLSTGAILLGTLVCVVIAAISVSALGGYVAGQRERSTQATQTAVAEIDVQYGLGLADMEAGKYGPAANRFRWILERNPNYPGAAERLAEAEQRMVQAEPTASILPPSTSQDPETLFAEAKGYYARQDWPGAIRRLQELQALDEQFRVVEVKEMLYVSLTTLGLSYVRGDRIEEGLFLLEQAEEIRPLDDQAAGERYLATLYSTGQTYWNLNWPVVIANFEAIYELAPNYRDISDRLWEAYIKYGDQLARQGAQCDAAFQYEAALALRDDSIVRDKHREAGTACANPTPLPTATPLGANTPTDQPVTPGITNIPDGDVTLTPTPLWNIP